jgi:polyhydroxybutyrate depolymerase
VHTITVDGMQRTYRLYRPAGLAPQAPLVVVLHAAFANLINVEQTSRFDRQADAGRFAVTYPEGIGKTWNAHGCCGSAFNDGIDDVGFITAMVEEIPGVDRRRVYATGYSNGGVMAYTLACTTDLFAAIGPMAATQFDRCTDPKPTSVMHIHGLADDVVRFNGTPKSDLIQTEGPPVPDVIAFWRRVDSCAPPVVTDNGPLTISGAKCPDNREVVLVTLDDLGHQWPDGAAARLWQFFERHPG